jgi:hypothetical protein
MHKLLTLATLGLALSIGAAHALTRRRPPTAQQSKMATCNKDAGDKKGDERKKFMSECLKAKPAMTAQQGPAGEDEDLQRRGQGQEGRRPQEVHVGVPEEGLTPFCPAVRQRASLTPAAAVRPFSARVLDEVDPQPHAQRQVLALRKHRVDAVGRRGKVFQHPPAAGGDLASTSQVLRQAMPRPGQAPVVQHLAVAAVQRAAGRR